MLCKCSGVPQNKNKQVSVALLYCNRKCWENLVMRITATLLGLTSFFHRWTPEAGPSIEVSNNQSPILKSPYPPALISRVYVCVHTSTVTHIRNYKNQAGAPPSLLSPIYAHSLPIFNSFVCVSTMSYTNPPSWIVLPHHLLCMQEIYARNFCLWVVIQITNFLSLSFSFFLYFFLGWRIKPT